ncbi:MAG: hypothetical protein ACREE6_10840 [Limisphaerales bacterium]
MTTSLPTAWSRLKPLIALLTVAPLGLFAQNLLLNGDFDSGNLTDWTTFLTPNGSLGSGLPDVVSFDVAGTGTASDAAQFQAGEIIYNQATGHTSQGGGIEQTFDCSAGRYVISADVAALYFGGFGNGLGNADAGLFTFLVDGNSVTNIELGGINSDQTIRGTLDATVALGGGDHSFALEITRPWLNDGGSYGGSPLEYVDYLSIVPVPEPIGLFILGPSAFWFVGIKARCGKKPKAISNSPH